MQGAASADLVLVGGGHAHVQVVRRWMMDPVAGVRLTLVLDRPEAVYSGMVPGFVAGDYAAHELEIDGVPLARRARARVILARAVGIDAGAHRVVLEGRPPIAWDVASLDVGSEVRGLDLPGVDRHALATRPIRRFVDALDARLQSLRASPRRRVVVVGAGAAGCELAFALEARLRGAGAPPELTLVGDGPRLLDGYPPRVGRRLEREARRRNIAVRLSARVRGATAEAVLLEGDGQAPRELPAELVVWATGAAAPAFLAASGLPTDADGYVRVGPTLQVEGHPDLFAAGDCADLPFAPWVRKAGVYAVRAGPVLDANLRARLAGRALRAFRPQRDFLTLLNLGDRRALGAKWGVVAAGRGVFRLKDAIDRRFVRRFRVLDEAGLEAAGFPDRARMGMPEMECGGCAAKVGPDALARALARLPAAAPDPSVLLGLAEPDDAAAWRLPRGDVLLATVDAFRAFCDDPWLVGRAAAVNAVSDVFATGGRPRHALAIVTVAEADARRSEETLYQVLAGIRAALDPLGVTLAGGHSTLGDELFVGLAVTGEPAGSLLAKRGAKPGDALVLTRALGTGLLLAADMRGLLPGRVVAELHAGLLRDNAAAARVARDHGAGAVTDVSGFGLAGHLLEMLRASRAGAQLRLGQIPLLPLVASLVGRGLRTTHHAQNAALRSTLAVAPAIADDPRLELLFDPQTCGGLLLAIPSERAAAAVAALRRGGDVAAAEIGRVVPAGPAGPVVEVQEPGRSA